MQTFKRNDLLIKQPNHPYIFLDGLALIKWLRPVLKKQSKGDLTTHVIHVIGWPRFVLLSYLCIKINNTIAEQLNTGN